MPPYSKLKEFMVEKYKEVAGDPKATTEQKLRALGHLEKLQPKRRNRPNRKANSGTFKKGRDPKTKAPKPIDSRLLGAEPAGASGASAAALLGLVENVEPLAEPLQPVGPASGT